MTKIEQLIENATSKDFDFIRGHTETLIPEQLVSLVAQDCYNLCRTLALSNPWTKSAHVQSAQLIATEYGLTIGEFDFIKLTDIKPGTHIMDLADWDDALSTGAINDDDGDGHWVKGTQESDIDCFDTKPAWATHVAWYNK